MKRLALLIVLATMPSKAGSSADRISLFPRLRTGQTFTYQVGYRSETRTKTQSSVVAPMAPLGGQTDAQLFLQCEVDEVRIEAGKTLARLRTRIVEPDLIAATNAAQGAGAASEATQAGKREKAVLFTLHANGQVSDVKGMEGLSAEEQAAWQEWVARFGVAAVFPERGVKLGEKWKTEEPIPSAALARLLWEKESEYVHDAPCKAMKRTAQGDLAEAEQAAEKCAVILTTATLRQKSSPKDATPDDYRLHDLRTMGTARGTNEIISYISLKTRLVVRATEEAKQSMNVVVAKADGTNRVQYDMDAQSHAEILLLADIALHPAEQPK